jgi:hypothetical protein
METKIFEGLEKHEEIALRYALANLENIKFCIRDLEERYEDRIKKLKNLCNEYGIEYADLCLSIMKEEF